MTIITAAQAKQMADESEAMLNRQLATICVGIRDCASMGLYQLYLTQRFPDVPLYHIHKSHGTLAQHCPPSPMLQRIMEALKAKGFSVTQNTLTQTVRAGAFQDGECEIQIPSILISW